MSSTYGDKIKISVFGESHGNGIGVVIDGLPAGFEQTIPTSFPAISSPLYR
jgi:chorismate synthase